MILKGGGTEGLSGRISWPEDGYGGGFVGYYRVYCIALGQSLIRPAVRWAKGSWKSRGGGALSGAVSTPLGSPIRPPPGRPVSSSQSSSTCSHRHDHDHHPWMKLHDRLLLRSIIVNPRPLPLFPIEESINNVSTRTQTIFACSLSPLFI